MPLNGEPGPGISGDKNNFSPRVGFAWSPGSDTRQVIYGGTGIYYDQVILNIIGNARFTPPKVIGIQIDSVAGSPLSWPDPFNGGTVSFPPPSVSIIDPELVTPWNWNSQIGYRRELASDVGLDVSFVYNRGYDHVGIINTQRGGARHGECDRRVHGQPAARIRPSETRASTRTTATSATRDCSSI